MSMLPMRWRRIARHFSHPFKPHGDHLVPNGISDWIFDLLSYLLDAFCIPDLYLIANLLFKPGIRGLNDYEKALVRKVYGNAVDISGVLIDPKAGFISKRFGFAYVISNLINYWGVLREDILIHEIMHVYQYQKFGLVYAYRAIKAQHSKEAYDYGGFIGLEKAMSEGKTLFDFNFEQQATILEHYFVFSSRHDSWENEKIIALYRHFRNYVLINPGFR
ncbi:MAG: hypothetical protein IPN29_10305 [Saprospiraceae bacterium]|nr:hypothetical protein [Saprospiraceae bacterium]